MARHKRQSTSTPKAINILEWDNALPDLMMTQEEILYAYESRPFVEFRKICLDRLTDWHNMARISAQNPTVCAHFVSMITGLESALNTFDDMMHKCLNVPSQLPDEEERASHDAAMERDNQAAEQTIREHLERIQ